MALVVVVVCVVGWIAIQFLDRSLIRYEVSSSYTELRYSKQLDVSAFLLTFHTERFNRILTKLGHRLSSLSTPWYRIGSIFTLFVFAASVPFLIFQILLPHFSSASSVFQVDKSAVPLVLPTSVPVINFLYIFLSVSLAVIFHELGHALCAVNEGAPLISVGLLSFLCFPGAFVKMDLQRLSAWGKIRTFCAGVWHNLVLGLICFIILQHRDTFMSSFYSTNSGFMVVDLSPKASISGDHGVAIGDVLLQVNDCDLRETPFNDCLRHLRTDSQLGFCEERKETDFVKLESVKECCPSENSTHICFESNYETGLRYGCLRARRIIESSNHFCTRNNDCDIGMFCVTPVVNETYHEKLLILKHENERILFLGDPFELKHTMVLINYIPRYWFIPKFAPQVLLKFLDYTFSFSMGMAFFNALPCIILDGNHISNSIIELVWPDNQERQLLVRVIVNTIGTFLIFIFILLQTIRISFR